MKKFFAILLSLLMIAALVACSANTQGTDDAAGANNGAAQAETADNSAEEAVPGWLAGFFLR